MTGLFRSLAVTSLRNDGSRKYRTNTATALPSTTPTPTPAPSPTTGYRQYAAIAGGI